MKTYQLESGQWVIEPEDGKILFNQKINAYSKYIINGVGVVFTDWAEVDKVSLSNSILSEDTIIMNVINQIRNNITINRGTQKATSTNVSYEYIYNEDGTVVVNEVFS